MVLENSLILNVEVDRQHEQTPFFRHILTNYIVLQITNVQFAVSKMFNPCLHADTS